jgi:signal transduction histidine kinase
VNVVTTAAAVLLAIVLMFSVEVSTWKEAMVRDIAIKADIIGNQCTAALTFDAPQDAVEILGALRADGQIDYAAVYTRGGTMFAAYRGQGRSAQVPAMPPQQGHVFKADHLELTRPVLLHADQIGTITIRVGLEHLRAVLFKYVTVSVAVLVIALLAASALLIRLQRSITTPVTDLARLMERVSRDKDYSHRADKSGPNELVSLAGSFNEMLSAIQSRDRDLERSLTELQTAYGKLKDLDQLKSDFISMVSHELRTPITSIKAFVDILGLKKNLTEERRKRILATISMESDRLTRLITDLLDLSRIESGVMQWRDQDTDISAVVLQAIAGILPLAQNRGIVIEDRSPEVLPSVVVDRDRIIQVVMNLLSNAIKFTPAGGTIVVESVLQAFPAGVSVSVRDTGRGIAASELGRIFEKFHRAGDAVTRAMEGTGLGLAICRQIVEHYGGRIWASSSEGRGSVFTFFIPLASRPEDAGAARDAGIARP